MTQEETQSIQNILRSNHDIFAWTHSDMKGIHPSIASHKLNVFSTARPVDRRLDAFIRIDKKLSEMKLTNCWKPDSSEKYLIRIGHALFPDITRFPCLRMTKKTAFITPHGLYCYKVMPFGLKNAGATYQRLMTKIFKPLIGHSVELNPSKCAFGVSAGKFLGFMVSQRGIEVSPDQVKAVMETPPPRNKRRYNVSQASSWSAWVDGQLPKRFGKIKHCLMQPPILSSPIPKEKLYMYLAVSEWAISAVLFRCPSPKEQKPIYYVSRALADVETRYSKMELTALALRSAAQKLRPYFQAHPVIVLTDQPLRNILHKPDLTGECYNGPSN
ncbi:hypothetical protein CK203_069637 [Vitis vinifera]|uniref:Reverse transcriptase/retrotransposon-derived protein RNase H-like domain-containing protein n=1 Tax=Vitis vinifera TaxID=29760 RepID=A0A438EKS3_VITVI|nr:hypothetical protein CK203_069637 [Vitis vinifera]